MSKQNNSVGHFIIFFLVTSAFTSILPFFPIILNKLGFGYKEIGLMFGLGQFISFLSNFCWSKIMQRFSSIKGALVVASLMLWITILSPVVLFSNEINHDKCHKPDNTTMANLTVEDQAGTSMSMERLHIAVDKNLTGQNSTKDFTILDKQFHDGYLFSVPLQLYVRISDFVFWYTVIYVISSSLMAITNYHYNALQYLENTQDNSLWVKAGPKKGKGGADWNRDLFTATNLPSGVMTVLVAVTLSKISPCESIFGGYSICFWVSASCLVLSAMGLQFLDDDSDSQDRHLKAITRNRTDSTDVGYSPVDCDTGKNHGNKQNACASITMLSLTFLCLGMVTSFLDIFLYLYMHQTDASVILIATVFASKKASETLIATFDDFVSTYFTMVDSIVICSLVNVLRCLVAATFSGNWWWFSVITEFGAGCNLLLHLTGHEINMASCLSNQNKEGIFADFASLRNILYVGMGTLYGCIVGGICLGTVDATVVMLSAAILSLLPCLTTLSKIDN
eukprot:Seg1190.12 transcript_id=Seg1190.12/GoldUCD/mRNA.D3Y31 product="hypothetical protein" protein_id=Seg1190.12/GoldUCD/D3Y31